MMTTSNNYRRGRRLEYLARAALEETVYEAAGVAAQIGANLAGNVDAERAQGMIELQSGAGDEAAACIVHRVAFIVGCRR